MKKSGCIASIRHRRKIRSLSLVKSTDPTPPLSAPTDEVRQKCIILSAAIPKARQNIQKDVSDTKGHQFVIDRSRLHDSQPCSARRASGLSKPGLTVLRVYRGALASNCQSWFHSSQKRARRPDVCSTRRAGLCVRSMARSSKPIGGPHSGTDHLVRNFPFSSNTCIRLLIGSAT